VRMEEIGALSSRGKRKLNATIARLRRDYGMFMPLRKPRNRVIADNQGVKEQDKSCIPV